MRKFIRIGLFALLSLLWAVAAQAQVFPITGTVQDNQGHVVPATTVIVLSGTTATVNTTTQPGSPLATIYSDPAGTQAINQSTNPAQTDGHGNFAVYAAAGNYVVQAYLRSGQQYVWPVFIGAGSGNVVGPASSTQYHLPYFLDTTGKSIGDSGIAAASAALKPQASDAPIYVSLNGSDASGDGKSWGTGYATLSKAVSLCGSNPCTIYDDSPETWTSNPLLGLAAGSTIKFLCPTISSSYWKTEVPLAVPQGVQVFGPGNAGGGSCALEAFPGWSGAAMIDIGPTTSGVVFGTGWHYANIGCNGEAPLAVYSNAANETSEIDHLFITDCSSGGIQLERTSSTQKASHSWIHDITIQALSAGTSATYGLKEDGYTNQDDTPYVTNITFIGNTSAPSTNGMILEGPTVFGVGGYLHCEQTQNCLAAGDTTSGISGVLAQQVELGPCASCSSTPTAVNIASTSKGVVVLSADAAATSQNLIVDNSVSPAFTLTGQLTLAGPYSSSIISRTFGLPNAAGTGYDSITRDSSDNPLWNGGAWPGGGGVTYPEAANQNANGADTILFKRFTDTSPTGYAWRLENNAALTTLAYMDVLGNIDSGDPTAAHMQLTPTGLLCYQSNGSTPCVPNLSGAEGSASGAGTGDVNWFEGTDHLFQQGINGYNLGGAPVTLTWGGSANIYTMTYDSTSPSISKGRIFAGDPSISNTGAATLNINSIGAYAIQKCNGAALSANDLVAGITAFVSYNGATTFNLLNPLTGCGSAGGVTSWAGDTVIFSNSGGPFTGAVTPTLVAAPAFSVLGNPTSAALAPVYTQNPSVSSVIFNGSTSGSCTVNVAATLGTLQLCGTNTTVTSGGNLFATTFKNSNGGFWEGNSFSGNSQNFLAGIDSSGANNSAYNDVALFRSADSTGTGSTLGGVAVVRGGLVTSATGTPGHVYIGEGYLVGTIATQWDVVAMTSTAYTVSDCATTCTNAFGVASSTTAPLFVIEHGQAPVNATAAVTIGHTVCSSTTTAGSVTDSGGTAPCTLGEEVGVVVATSGTITVGSGTTSTSVTLSTTLPLVALRIQ